MLTRSYCLFCLVLSLTAHHALAQDMFRLNTEENPPFSYSDEKTGQHMGIELELVEEVFKQADIPYQIVTLPWPRAYQEAMNERNTCVFMTAQTEDRMGLFKWVGPFLKVEWVIYGRPDETRKINSIEDLKKWRVGGYISDAPAEYLKNRGVPVDFVTIDALNPKKLDQGRIDAWATNNVRGPLIAKKISVKLKQLYSLRVISHYVACNRSIDQKTVDSLNRKVQRVKAQGLFEKKILKYQKMGLSLPKTDEGKNK